MLLVLLKAAEASAAFHSFGVRAYNFQKYGDSVSIEVPENDKAPHNEEFATHRAVVQADYTAKTGLVQLGIYRSGNGIQMDNCGTRSGWTFFGEWKSYGTANEVANYHCALYSETNAGNNTLFHIWRWGNASTNEWEMEINNGRVGTYKPNFGSGYPEIGGEIAGVHSPPAISKTLSWYALTRPWHSYNQIGAGEPFQITNPGNTNVTANTGWSVDNVPGPIQVLHE